MNYKRTVTAIVVALSSVALLAAAGCSAGPTVDTYSDMRPEAAPSAATDVAGEVQPDVSSEATPPFTADLAIQSQPDLATEAMPPPGSELAIQADAVDPDQVPGALEVTDTPLPAAATRSPVPSSTPSAIPDAPSAIPDAPSATPDPPAAIPTASENTTSKASTSTTQSDVVAVSLAEDNRIAEIDSVTGKLLRFVDFSRPSGSMATSSDGSTTWVFRPQASAANLAVFDLLSGERHQDLRFRESDRPSAAIFSSDGARAYVAAGDTVIYATSGGKEYGRVSVGHQSPGVQVVRQISSLAVVPGGAADIVYAAGQSSGLVWALEGSSGAVLNEINVGGGPFKIVVDPARQRAYVLLDTVNQLVAIDTTTHTITSRLKLSARPLDAALSPDGTLLITGGDADGVVWVVPAGATEIQTQAPLEGKPAGLAISRDGKSLYIPDTASSRLNIVTADTLQVTRSIQLPSVPVSVVASRPATAVVDPKATPQATPSPLAPTPTPLPNDALPPDRLPAGTIAEPYVPGAAEPVAMAFAPDGRLFYNEQRTGKIRIVKNGALLPDPFYQLLVDGKGDGGLVGLTLDPDFVDNHYVYAMYTLPGTPRNKVVRLTDVDGQGTDLKPILQDLPAATGEGALTFGPDGKLYASIGDDDNNPNAQDLKSLAGKVLRVNSDGSTPIDNPFVGQPGKQELIWAFGLGTARNLAFHPLGHQLLSLVSQGSERDALELIVRGANLGWPGSSDKPASGVTAPLATIKPAIRPSGSTFYTGDQLAEWKNDLFYCDAAQGQLRHVRFADQSFDRVAFEEVVRQGCTDAVATGPDGALYYSDAHGIYRIRKADTGA
jgi:glucose/arabinose dehydrogenase